MTSASWALQQAIYGALSQCSALKSYIGDPIRLYDDPPRAPTYPYLIFSEDTESDWGTVTDEGCEHRIVIHVLSKTGGKREIKSIADALKSCLTEATFNLSEHHLVSLCFQKATYQRDNDSETFLATIEYRAVTEPLT